MKSSYNHSILLLLFLLPFFSFSQEYRINGEVKLSTIINSGNQTPFWFWANQMGQIQQTSELIQNGELFLKPHFNFKNGDNIFFGARVHGSLGAKNDVIASELFGGIHLNKIILQGGAWGDTVIHGGLSSSNGNLLNSRNARPYPKVGIRSNGFIRIKKNFSMAGNWEEGILRDNRAISNARLHHKNLFFRWGTTERFQFTFGIDHYAFWGGTSEKLGSQPSGFTDYLRSIFAMKGGAGATLSDQQNVAGNSLGQYLFIFTKDYKSFKAEARIAHPFEDFSGMAFENYPDNLYSVYITRKKSELVRNLLIEFLYSKNQSGSDVNKNGVYIHRNGRDSYFNHGAYSSGFTYFGQMMGSPFFYPVLFNDAGIPQGIGNNRLIAFHLAGSGYLADYLGWRIKGSFSRNYGTYSNPYSPARTQFSGLLGFSYESPRMPFNLNCSFAYDSGGNINNGDSKQCLGLMLAIEKRF